MYIPFLCLYYKMKLTICILAGGLGKRMNSTLPKVCHLFKNKPMIVHIINNALELVAHKIIIITGKFNDIIQETIKKYIDIESFNKLIFVEQNEPLGTGHAVKCSLKEYNDDENVLILNGDTPNLSTRLLTEFINYNFSNKLLISEVNNPYGYGRIVMNDSNDIQKIVEEKDASEHEKKINKINSGIYLIESKYLLEFIPLIKNNNKSKEYYLTDIIEIMINNNINIHGYLINKKDNNLILGINTLEQLNNLEKM